MNVKTRQDIERRIARAAAHGLIHAGYFITINDSEEDVLVNSVDEAAIEKAMFSTDEDMMIVSVKSPSGEFSRCGWVKFIYGNDGWDVISDYTTNLEVPLQQAREKADALEARYS